MAHRLDGFFLIFPYDIMAHRLGGFDGFFLIFYFLQVKK